MKRIVNTALVLASSSAFEVGEEQTMELKEGVTVGA